MRHLPVYEIAHRLARQVACTQCYQRPTGSEALGPDVPRECEATCSLFFHLPTLVKAARHLGDGPGACEKALMDCVCATCRLRPTAGPFCADYAARTCPVSRYGADVIASLERAERFA